MARLSWILATIVLAANSSPAPRQIGAYHFDWGSQVWIRLEPRNLEPGPDPIQLNVTVSFPGSAVERQPDTVELRVESVAGTFPTRVRKPIFALVVDNTTELDLTDQAHSFQFISRCPECSADTVTARVPFHVLRNMSGSKGVVVKALGFSARLTAADLAALDKYVAALSSGVVIK